MKKFNPNEYCPKCGYKEYKITLTEEVPYYPEQLKVTCKTCGYSGEMACMDSEEENAKLQREGAERKEEEKKDIIEEANAQLKEDRKEWLIERFKGI